MHGVLAKQPVQMSYFIGNKDHESLPIQFYYDNVSQYIKWYFRGMIINLDYPLKGNAVLHSLQVLFTEYKL